MRFSTSPGVDSQQQGERFLTVAFLVLQGAPDGVAATLRCGGHPSPLVLWDVGDVEEAMCRGELVGVFQAWDAEDVDLLLEPATPSSFTSTAFLNRICEREHNHKSG